MRNEYQPTNTAARWANCLGTPGNDNSCLCMPQMPCQGTDAFHHSVLDTIRKSIEKGDNYSKARSRQDEGAGARDTWKEEGDSGLAEENLLDWRSV